MSEKALKTFKREELILKYENGIKNYQKRIEILKNIKRVSKKDGSDFERSYKQNFNLEYENCYLTFEKHYCYNFLDSLKVYSYDLKDYMSIDLTYCKRQNTDNEYTEEELNNFKYLCDNYYQLSVEKVFEKIEDLINIYNNNIIKYQQVIEDIKNDYNNIITDIEKLRDKYIELSDYKDERKYSLYMCLYSYLGY